MGVEPLQERGRKIDSDLSSIPGRALASPPADHRDVCCQARFERNWLYRVVIDMFMNEVLMVGVGAEYTWYTSHSLTAHEEVNLLRTHLISGTEDSRVIVARLDLRFSQPSRSIRGAECYSKRYGSDVIAHLRCWRGERIS